MHQVTEIDNANLALIKITQQNYFEEEIKDLDPGNFQVPINNQ